MGLLNTFIFFGAIFALLAYIMYKGFGDLMSSVRNTNPAPKFTPGSPDAPRVARGTMPAHGMPGDSLSEVDIIQHRAHDLARLIEHAVEFGGSDLLETYSDTPSVGEQLYRSGIETVSGEEAGTVLQVRQGLSTKAPRGPGKYFTPVRYVLTQRDRPLVTKVARVERWFWEPAPRRCDNCGAPNATNRKECQYCGVSVDGQIRWVVAAVERADAKQVDPELPVVPADS